MISTLNESKLYSDTHSILHFTFLIMLIMGLILVIMSLKLSKEIAYFLSASDATIGLDKIVAFLKLSTSKVFNLRIIVIS